MNPLRPKIVLFDLGGVLFEYNGSLDLAKMRQAPFADFELSRFWLESQWAADLATERCSPHDFARGAIGELELIATPDEFLALFSTWLRGYMPRARALLERVRGRARLACLSNTNEIDAARFRTEFKIEQLFDECFFSNEMGLRKPDGDVFAYVLDALGIAPADVLFLDDTPECVEGARRSGIRAEVALGPLDAQRILEPHFFA